ncbi:MAG: FAD binding domain-containing protein [Candidatus Marinimicrobia bacterium]|nr:FAD binding domain-containing protein [Candidatus Neomarinimicrobiota bacterium]
MTNIKWFYPTSLAEASALLERKSILPHGGGTNLTRRNLAHVEGVINLANLGLNYVKKNKAMIEIGSMSSYADVVAGLRSVSPGNILIKALKDAANTPCRNRITIGGSIAFVPKWSDLIGALLALEAKVVLVGNKTGEFLLSEYLYQRELQEQTLICAVKFKDFIYRSGHYRDIKTQNDMPLFTITVLLKMNEDHIEQAKVFVVGTKERISHMEELEKYLINKTKSEISENKIYDLVELLFVGKRITDPEYLSYKVKIETARTIFRILENN